MQEVHYDIKVMAPGEVLRRPAHVAGYFYHVLEGEIEAVVAGEARLSAGPKDTLVASGFVGHVIQNHKFAPARVLIGTEPYEYLSWLPATFTLSLYPYDPDDSLNRRLLLAMALVIEEISDPVVAPDQLSLERTAELIIFYFFRMGSMGDGQLDPFPWSDKRLMASVSAMQDDPARNWTLDQLAKLASMSRSAFAERFRQVLGVTPMQMLSEFRLRVAMRNLQQGASISETALRCGYGSDEAFIRAFKRVFGNTPARWLREQHRSMLDA
ncbi:MAG: helix-turn-helix transcriptional regulator [Pseudomonadales bacterium]|nr:helix-turn-helix transcriptional regulator [Pseudomonadales bacterium]